MDKFTAMRFSSLENSIKALRILNQSKTLSRENKLKNLSLLQEYQDEIVDIILEEGPIDYYSVKGHPNTLFN